MNAIRMNCAARVQRGLMEGELLAIEHRWAKAFRTMDRDVFEQVLAAEFRLSFVSDPRAPRTVSREEWMAMLDRMSMGE